MSDDAQAAPGAFDILVRAIAALLVGSLVVECWHDVSQAFDVWYYHVPFAARLARIVDAQSYLFGPDNQARFEGYPLLAELLQGLLWRATGRVEATNFVSLLALLALPFYLWRAFRVPLHLSLLALLAIPLVQIHASSSYVDLPANACVTVLLLEVYRALTANGPPSTRSLLFAASLAAAAANMKFQLVPIVALASGVMFLAALRTSATLAESRRPRMWIFVLAAPIVLATPLKNVALHGNPVWPVELRVAGVTLPHREEAYASSPRHLEHAARPVRFLRSVLEVDNRPIASGRRWSIDQFTPTDEPGYRMGGYFGAYVVVQSLGLGILAWWKRSREVWGTIAMMLAVTAVTSMMPQSHELRYYMHWMMLFVSLNLIHWSRVSTGLVGAVALAAFGIVAWSTEATYLYASGKSAAQLVEARVDRARIQALAPGERLCVGRPPYNFLYAAIFHPGSHHRVEERATDANCRESKPLP